LFRWSTLQTTTWANVSYASEELSIVPATSLMCWHKRMMADKLAGVTAEDYGGGEISATKSQMMCATDCFRSPALLDGVCWTYLTRNRSHRPRSLKI
jgi:hypothetical protein